jgi:hypothetical protein
MRRSEQAIHGMSVVYQARTRHSTRIQPPTPQRKRLRLSKSDCASRAYVQRSAVFTGTARTRASMHQAEPAELAGTRTSDLRAHSNNNITMRQLSSQRTAVI